MSTITYASEYIVDPNESLGDYSTIQTAIIASSDGDTITVNPGTYTENINMMNKAITLQSTEPTNPTVVLATIIEGNGESSIVCTSGEDSNTLITGFLITKSNSADWGGGICNFSSSPTVTNCTFSGNSATYLGGGILNADSSPTVTNCTFSGNSAGWSGGGMYNAHSLLTDSMFNGDSATYSGEIYNYTPLTTVSGCTFSGNSATVSGGGIYNDSSPSLTLTNSYLCLNTLDAIGGDGYTNGGGNNLQFCPPPKSIVEGDLTDDNKVDFEDFAILAANWLEGTE